MIVRDEVYSLHPPDYPPIDVRAVSLTESGIPYLLPANIVFMGRGASVVSLSGVPPLAAQFPGGSVSGVYCATDDGEYAAADLVGDSESLSVELVKNAPPAGGDVYRIAGDVTLNQSQGVARDVLVISNDAGSRSVVGEGQSGADGALDITYTSATASVIALALDDYGVAWQPETAYAVGAVLHPATPNGYVYAVTVAGTTAAQAPEWPTSGSVTNGSVTLEARPYYRPVASGPLEGQLVDP